MLVQRHPDLPVEIDLGEGRKDHVIKWVEETRAEMKKIREDVDNERI